MKDRFLNKAVASVLSASIIVCSAPVFATVKDETVYSKTKADGTSYKVEVSDHLKNTENEKVLEDISDLLNIVNSQGEEKYDQNGNKLTWQADGKDIYYQGQTQKELPIDVKIKYELDGNEISPEELAGKSGRVKITIQYENKDKKEETVNGKTVTMYTPFIVGCGTIIDNTVARNISISTGKLVDNGEKTIAIGLAFPGLSESLGVEENSEISIPEDVVLEMDATNFSLSSILSFVTPKLLEDSDLDKFGDLDSMYDQVSSLQDASNQLEEGAHTLQSGTDEYTEKSTEFNSAMKQVKEGMSRASKNYDTIDNGISSVDSGSQQLENGIATLKEKAGDLTGGLTSLQTGAEQLEAGAVGLKKGASDLSDGLGDLIAGKKAENDGYATLEALLKQNEQIAAALKASGIDTTNLDKVIEGEKQAITQMKIGGKKVEGGLQKMKSQVDDKEKGLIAGASSLASGTKTLNAGVKKLTDNLPGLLQGVDTLANGSKDLASGAKALQSGSKQLRNGLHTLDTSTTQLTNANNQLLQGANTLKEGVSTLSNGITTFNKEGIEKIVDLVNGDVKDISERAKKLMDLSKEYDNFTMLNDGTEGNVKFILISDGIKKAEEADKNKEDAAILNNENTKEEKTENQTTSN